MDPPERIQVNAPPRSKRGARSVEFILIATIVYVILSFFEWGLVRNVPSQAPRPRDFDFDMPAQAGGKTNTKIVPPRPTSVLEDNLRALQELTIGK
mmetsp:Transcript_17955/g.25458  ORF Transcript_17955/g.25458 Transcript_17955/m.25458 type:complete len:96 (+) Transcript_17955:1-288(+)